MSALIRQAGPLLVREARGEGGGGCRDVGMEDFV